MIVSATLIWASLLISSIALLLTIFVWWRLVAHMKENSFKSIVEAVDTKSIETGGKNAQSGKNGKKLEALNDRITALEERQVAMICDVSTIRFDAFDDIGGKQSFAAAFLDSRRDGVVLTGINGRHESRTYAKPIEKGESFFKLSAEEVEAIEKAQGTIKT